MRCPDCEREMLIEVRVNIDRRVILVTYECQECGFETHPQAYIPRDEEEKSRGKDG